MLLFLSSLLWLVLWLFGLSVLICYSMRWWPGDRFWPVRFIDYFMPWLLCGLVPCLVAAGLTRHKWLALALLAPTCLIVLTYLPVFLNCFNAGPADGTILKVMSYNIWHKNQNMAAVAKVIGKEKPDILLLQEVRSHRLQQLVDNLIELYSEDQLHLAYNRLMRQAVISRYPLTPLKSFSAKNRAQKVLVEPPFGPIVVINIHAYKWRWMNRHRQMRLLLKEDISPEKYPLILAGDFNTSDQSETCRMVNQYLQNAHWKAGCGFGFTYPSPAFKYKGKISIPALIRIDHIFCSNQFIPRSSRTLTESGGSDHFPVVTDLYLISKMLENS